MRVFEKIKVTEKMIVDFSEITGDKNPIHLDQNYAKTTIFGQRIAHGVLLLGFISKIIAEKYPGEGSIYLSQSVNFLNPCYIDDEITVSVELIEKINKKYILKTEISKNELLILSGESIILKKNN